MQLRHFGKRLLKAFGKKPFKIVFTYYSPDGNDFSMPLACLSGYVKQYVPQVEVSLVAILPLQKKEAHTVAGYVRRISDQSPDLVAISCYTPNWVPLDAYLRALKQALPDVPVIVGGCQAVLNPKETIAHPCVDYVCAGDGESPLAQLIMYLRGDGGEAVPGIWRKESDGSIIESEPLLTENLAAVPFPDYGLFERQGTMRGLNLSNFARSDLFILPVMSGRGCPYHCTYCSNESIQNAYRGKGKFMRKYDAESLVNELCRLKDRYSVQFFEFWDEMFNFNRQFIGEFLGLYKKKLRIPFSFMARVEAMDDAFCRAAGEAGCSAIWFGIECGNETYRRDVLNRAMTNQQIMTAAESARRYGIQLISLNMVGMPFETRENMLETLSMNRSLKPEFFAFFIYLPLKGTPLYELVQKHSLAISDTAGDILEGVRNESFRMNIREHAGCVTSREFEDICNEMIRFANENNRLNLREIRY